MIKWQKKSRVIVSMFYFIVKKQKKNSRQTSQSLRLLTIFAWVYYTPCSKLFQDWSVKLKYGNDFYLQLSRHLFADKYKNLSINAKWLYVVLNELEQRYTGKDANWFFRTDADLAVDSGMSEKTLKRAKAELKESGLVEISIMHWVDKETGKKSKKKVTAYTIPRSEPKAYEALGMKKKPYL